MSTLTALDAHHDPRTRQDPTMGTRPDRGRARHRTRRTRPPLPRARRPHARVGDTHDAYLSSLGHLSRRRQPHRPRSGRALQADRRLRSYRLVPPAPLATAGRPWPTSWPDEFEWPYDVALTDEYRRISA